MRQRDLCAVVLVILVGVASAMAQHDKSTPTTINIRDYCDPASFNAAIGPDTCVRDISTGSITFEGFVAELQADQSVGAWRFAPAQLRVGEGTVLELQK